jgi:prepilin-type N-terminal cleavage/methylation domain-containing protein
MLPRFNPLRFRYRLAGGGFTLVEVLVATVLLGLLSGSSIWALSQANNYASIARLYTGAQTAAQNQVDYLMADTPFNPQNGRTGHHQRMERGY